VIEALVAKEIFHINLVQLQSYAKKHCFIEDADEFAGMISFYHGLGMIIKHRNTVVLKAQWLIDLLRQLITIPHFDKMVGKRISIQWNLELTKSLGTGQICSLNRGFVILKTSI